MAARHPKSWTMMNRKSCTSGSVGSIHSQRPSCRHDSITLDIEIARTQRHVHDGESDTNKRFKNGVSSFRYRRLLGRGEVESPCDTQKRAGNGNHSTQNNFGDCEGNNERGNFTLECAETDRCRTRRERVCRRFPPIGWNWFRE